MVAVFEVEERMHKQQKPDPENLGFGRFFTDYMFSMDYSQEEGWHNKKNHPLSGNLHEPCFASASLWSGSF